MGRFPGKVRITGESPAEFHHRPDYFAVHQARKRPAAGSVTTMADSAETRFAVFQGEPGPGIDAGPVYSSGRDGPLAVPTGRVFVRLAAGVTPDERRADFAAMGFEIEKTMSYAPNAAWLRPTTGGAAMALRALGKLEKVPGVVHVEPQMLLERALRKG